MTYSGVSGEYHADTALLTKAGNYTVAASFSVPGAGGAVAIPPMIGGLATVTVTAAAAAFDRLAYSGTALGGRASADATHYLRVDARDRFGNPVLQPAALRALAKATVLRTRPLSGQPSQVIIDMFHRN